MSFDVAAESYDRFMGRFSQPLAVEFADWVGVPAGVRALDVGCGPGALTRVLVDRLGTSAVSAVDPSESFVDAARSRIPWLDVRVGAAESLPFDDDSFDACLAELVVHFMTDAAAGVAEMTRVTRPGGTVAACVWDFENGRAPQSTFFRACRDVLGPVDDESERAGARRGQLAALLSGAGCRDVAEAELTVSVAYATFADWWDPYTLGVAPAGRLLASQTEDARAEIRTRAAELLPDAPFHITATAWAAKGTA